MMKATFNRSFVVYAVFAVLCVMSAGAQVEARARGRAGSPVAAAATLNLRDFGAVGDGATDDAPALQRALDALASAGGGTLFVPAGRYAISTPVGKDFAGAASVVSITGVESSAEVAPINSTGNEMTRGLALSSEFYPRTGAQQTAVSISGLRSLLVRDIAFVGTPDVVNDALITLDLRDIDSATISHSEFYGLSSLSPGGSIVQAVRSSLRVEESLFLGCTAASAYHTPVVHNIEWKGIAFEHVIFADYGQRPELYGKCHLSAPVSWINIGNAAQPTSDSPRREVMVRNTVLDEGGFWGLTALPYFYLPASARIDLVYVSGLRMNVSNLGKIGHLFYNVQNAMIERSTYEWNDTTASAATLFNVGHAVVSEITCLAGVRTIRADDATQKLTVINSGCTDIDSQAQATGVVSGADGEANAPEYVRAQYEALAGRAPEPAGHFYWTDLLIRCGDDAPCQDEQRAALAGYLAHAPAPAFTLAGSVKDENGVALAGATVALSGSQTVSTTTDAGGRYSFSNLPTSGRYAVAARATHYAFEPENVVTPAGDVTLDIHGKLNRHTIGGRLSRTGGTGMAGVSVRLVGSQTDQTATTNAAGDYSFPNLPEGLDYVVTPSHDHYTFAPLSRSVNNLSANQTADFNGTLKTHAIGGRVAEAGVALSGVTVSLGGSQSATATTDAQGNYSFPNLPAGGNYIVTPSRPHYAFTPATLAFNNLSADQAGNFNAVPNTHAIGGRVTDAANNALPGATVTLGGAQSKVATTDANGAYLFTGLNGGGNYTLTPTLANYTFNPSNASFNDLGANQTANFTATLANYTLGGRISDAANAGLAGATVTLGGAKSATTTTDAQGNYSFAGLPATGNYTLTPTLANYTFTPPGTSFNNLGANRTANFTATRNRHRIAGQIKDGNNVALAGVAVALSGEQGATTTTDAQGNYSFAGVSAGGDYTVTPARQNYTFAPAGASFQNLSANQTANFTASLNSHAISGRVTDGGGNALANVTLNLAGARTASVLSDAAGNYTFPNLPAGNTYTVTPSLANYTFAPTGRTFDGLSADQKADFNGALNLHKISGRIGEGANGTNGLAGVTVALSGRQTVTTTTTDAQGNYAFAGIAAGGNYTVAPSLANYTFTPASQAFNNLSADGTANFNGTLRLHVVGGLVTDAANNALPGVAVTLTGSQSATTTTDAGGNYSFPNLPAGGNYTVTPSRPHYAFTPATLAFNNLSADQAGNFNAVPNTHAIGGRVTDAANNALPGATITLGGAQSKVATTDANGAYLFTGLNGGGNYTLTPTLANYTFNPSNASFNDLGANQTANFAATLANYTLGGRISDAANAGLAGATVTLGGAKSATTTTDAQGNYSFAGVSAGGNYTVTPVRQNYTFTPRSLAFTNLDGDRAGANFDGALNRYSIGGRVLDAAGAVFAGVTLELRGDQSATTTTDAGGNYSFPGLLAGGNYTVAASKRNFTFTPPLKAFATLSGDEPGADFTAASAPKTVQFGQANYQVSEGSVSATLIVTRTGDTSEAATAEYMFAESAEGVPCSTADGTANPRCDYQGLSDVVAFAPGEDTKEISIQLIDDGYVEGAETLRLHLVSVIGATLGAQSTATLLIQDNDTAAGQNPIFSTPFFVRMQYLDFLSREPEAGEPWSGVLNRCSDVNNNPACDRLLVSQSFFGSPEFRLKGFYVFNFYRVAFGRRPSYEEVIPDMRSITGATAEETYRKRASFSEGFTDGAEFKDLYDALDDTAFVKALLDRYELAQLTTPDPANPEGGTKVTLTRAELVRRLGVTGEQTLTRSQVLRAVVESDEVSAAEYNRAFVAMQYYGYLRRTPEDAGYEAWLRVINQDPNNIRIMVNGFMNSAEYQLRFGSPKAAGSGTAAGN
jgi:hypothetical protein